MAISNLDKLPIAWHEEAARARHDQLLAMYEQKKVHVSDFLKADLGDTPHKGLDITHAPDFELELRSNYSHPAGIISAIPSITSFAIGYYFLSAKPILFISYLISQAVLSAASLGGFVSPNSRPYSLHVNDMYRLFSGTANGRARMANLFSHEFKHVMQSHDSKISMTSALDDDRYPGDEHIKDGSSKMVKYLASEAEIQARLYTIMVGAYRQFDHWPTTLGDLYACLKSQGIDIPENQALRAKSVMPNVPDEERDQPRSYQRNDALYDIYADERAIDGINTVIEHLKESDKRRFFTTTLPRIYGDILELMGDKYGSKRMGFRRNVQLHEIFLKNAWDDYTDITSGPDETAARKKMIKAVAAMSRDDAFNLCASALSREVLELASGVEKSLPHTRSDTMRAVLHTAAATHNFTMDDVALLKAIAQKNRRAQALKPRGRTLKSLNTFSRKIRKTATSLVFSK